MEMERQRKKDTGSNYNDAGEDTMIYDTRKRPGFINNEQGVFDLKSVGGINSQGSVFSNGTVFDTRR